MRKLITAAFILLLLISFYVPQVKAAWLSGWGYRVQIDIDSGDIDVSLASFPVLIYLTNSTSGIYDEDISFVFDEIKANYLKLAVTIGEDQETFVEVEQWIHSAEIGILWANVTASQSANTTLYLYYDITHANNTAYVDVTGTGNSVNVWDDDFLAVFHMRDNTTSTSADSTINDNDGTKQAANEPAVSSAGMIGEAQLFDGTNDYIGGLTAAVFELDIFTIESWAYRTTDITADTIFRVGDSDNFNGWFFWFRGTDMMAIAEITNSGGVEWSAEDGFYMKDLWHYGAATCEGNGNTASLYVNGALEDTDPQTTIQYSGSIARIGMTSKANTHPFAGYLDELRFSNVSRSASWVKASYESGKDDLLDYGEEEVPAPITYTVTLYINSGGILRVDNVTVANGTETEYANLTVLELIALVEGNLTYGFDNFTWNGNHNYSNPSLWTVTFGVSNLTLWCYYAEFSPGVTIEERAFGTVAFVAAIIALAVGVVFGKKAQ